MNWPSALQNEKVYAQKHLVKEIRAHLTSITKQSTPNECRIPEQLIQRAAKFGCETGPELWDQIASAMTGFNKSLDENFPDYDSSDADGMWTRWRWISERKEKQNVDLSILETRLEDLDWQILSRWVIAGLLLSIGAGLGKFLSDTLWAFVRGAVGFLSNGCGG